MQGKGGQHSSEFQKYQQKAEYFMCSCLGKGSQNVQKTPGGLIFRQRWNNLQFVTSASFLLTVYSDYLSSAHKYLKCSNGYVSPTELLSFAKSQVKNPSTSMLNANPHLFIFFVVLAFILSNFLFFTCVLNFEGGLHSW